MQTYCSLRVVSQGFPGKKCCTQRRAKQNASTCEVKTEIRKFAIKSSDMREMNITFMKKAVSLRTPQSQPKLQSGQSHQTLASVFTVASTAPTQQSRG